LEQDVQSEIQGLSQLLTGRITELAERYESTLPQLNTQVAELEKIVTSHLSKMGFTWK
jgi:type I restriction enzyme M protein